MWNVQSSYHQYHQQELNHEDTMYNTAANYDMATFLQITHNGPILICLYGWYIGDASWALKSWFMFYICSILCDFILHLHLSPMVHVMALCLMPPSHYHHGWIPFYFMYDWKYSTTFPWCMINAPVTFAWCMINAPVTFAWCMINAPVTFAWCMINAPVTFAWCMINAPVTFAWCMNHFIHKLEFSYIGWNGVHPLWLHEHEFRWLYHFGIPFW